MQVFEALGAMKFPYIYPDPESRRLRAALAQDSGLEDKYILVGCGADELIDLIMRYVFNVMVWKQFIDLSLAGSKFSSNMFIRILFGSSFLDDI